MDEDTDNFNKTNNALKYINKKIDEKISSSLNIVIQNHEILNNRLERIENMLEKFLSGKIEIPSKKEEEKKKIYVPQQVIEKQVVEKPVQHYISKNLEPILNLDIIKNEKKNEPMIIQKKESDSNLSQKYYYKELKIESFDIDENIIKKCLEMHNLAGDIYLFQKMYIDDIPKEYYPIRHIKKKFQYWCDDHMNDDHTNGVYIRDIILKNIEECYMKVNIIENYKGKTDLFLANQEHIYNLSELKYKDKFLSKIISIL